MSKYNSIVVLGPTASGKTGLACRIAAELNGEIISADSRQVYTGLNIGAGKDLHEYELVNQKINYHLIDICKPDQQFYLHDFIHALENAFSGIVEKKKLPVICGGTGLYLDALRKDFSFTQVPEDPELRAEMEELSNEKLINILNEFPAKYTQHADLNSRKRLIRAIEIATYMSKNPDVVRETSRIYNPFYIGISVDLEERKNLISGRLKSRLNQGLIEEVEGLLHEGISHERLQFLGLEYKFVSFYLQNKISKEELFLQLQTGIFQFAKRQMTWFRKMEKEGVKINWIRKSDLAEGLPAILSEFV